MLNLAITASNYSACPFNTVALTAFGSNSYTWTGSSLANPVIQQSVGVTPGTYTVSSAATNSVCVANTAISSAPPLVITTSLSPGQGTTCIAQNFPYPLSKPVNLYAFGASSYFWVPYNPGFPVIGPSITVRPATSTCYTVTGFTALCSGSAQICIGVQPQFTFDVAQSMQRYPWEGYEPASFFCRFFNCALNVYNVSPFATGPLSAFIYNWNFAPTMSVSSPGTPTVMFVPLSAFSYTAEIIDAQGCISTPYSATPIMAATCHFGNVSLNSERDKDAFFEIYPNPAKGQLFIRTQSGTQNFSVMLSDVLGKSVQIKKPQRNFANDNYFIDLADLKQGIYFLSIFSEGKILYRSKIVKE
ncbi:MAG TPA: T9SS type A sorting domain-containing protein [Bacteroidia bacterium]|nr:T9SS type A sorting domain-containing protein [Bacteroidia bacterium]